MTSLVARLTGHAGLRRVAENVSWLFVERVLLLALNFATSAAGGIRVEIQDVDGQPCEGFSLADCNELIGNELDRVVRFAGGELAAMAGRPVRLRFVLRDADLFSLRFR